MYQRIVSLNRNITTSIILMLLPKSFVRSGLLYLVFLLPLSSFTQNLPNIIHPSPQSQELSKYVEFPVDYSTGVPDISIPLYEIRVKGMTIPITLNYHASGIKAGQDDGDVGVGWSLSCNYRVSRTIYGRPDSKDIEMPSNFETAIQTYTNNLIQPLATGSIYNISSSQVQSALQTYLNRDKYLSRFSNIHDPNMNMPPLAGNLLDGEYDHFNYMLPGQSGTFIISNRTTKTVSEFNPSLNSYEYIDDVASNGVTSGVIGFKIKDGSQNAFSFGEQVDKTGFNVLEAVDNYYQKTVATAWALTDIDTKYGEKVKFGYTNRLVTSKYQIQTVINSLSCGSSYQQLTPSYMDVWKADVNTEFSSRSYNVFALSSIVTPRERIEFIASTNTFFNNKVDQINIYDVSTNVLVKRIQFHYSRIEGYPSGYIFLDSVDIIGGDLADNQTYSFAYYNHDLPSSTVLVPDQWGYNKIGSSIYSILHNEFKTDPMGHIGSPCESYYYSSTLDAERYGYYSDRRENPNPEIFSLKAIAYPTGGKTVYEYEANKIAYGLNDWRQWGGVRVKAITHFDGGVAKLKRLYKYGLNENGLGAASYYADHTEFRREHVVIPTATNVDFPIGSTNVRRAADYSSYSQGDPVELDSRVHYSFVTEYISSVDNAAITNGKTEFKYDFQYPISSRVAFPGEIFNDSQNIMKFQSVGPTYITKYEYWRKPLLVEKTYYSATNSPVKKETYTYTEKSYPTFKGFKVRPFARVDGSFDQYLPYYYLYIGSFYIYDVYSIETGVSLLWQKQETLYSESGPLTATTTFSYNPHNQVVSEITTDSKSQVVERNTVYSSDKSGWGGVFAAMFQANDLTEVLEQSEVKNNNITSQITTEYTQLAGGIFVPNKIKRFNTVTQVFDDEIIYARYDSRGNVLTVSKALGMPLSYVWSYKRGLPIAQVTGATYDAIESVLGSAVIEEFSTRASPTKTEIDNFLAPLRTAIITGTLPNAEIQSFSYKPLLGMESQTDLRGRSVYYEYNGMGNLSLVRDHDGKILKKYQYNYEGQPESDPAGCTNTTANWVNVGTSYCEIAGGVNTGRQLQNQVDNNPCSSTYNSIISIQAGTNTSTCPMTVYARISYENYFSYPPYETDADVVVRFYSDAACLNPISVTGLQLNYTQRSFDGTSNYSYNGSVTVNGTYVVLEYAAILFYSSDGITADWSEDYILRAGSYSIL